MPKSIKEIFDKHCGHLKFDKRLIKQIREIRLRFLHRNEDHLEFFSGNLLGVNPIRYRTVDRQEWLEELLEVNEPDIKEEVAKLGTIDKDWVRANDAVNLSMIWVLHKIVNSPHLSAKEKDQGLKDTCLLLQYKFLSSIMAHYFPFVADKTVAMATYEALSRKFELKQYGSWQSLLEHRCNMILNSNSIHYNTYLKMPTGTPKSDPVIYMINDVQDRLREIVKRIRDIFEKVKNQNLRISSTSSVIELEGQSELVDSSRDHSTYVRYIRTVVSDKPTFIRKELIEVVGDVIQTLQEPHLISALEYCSNNFGKGGDSKVSQLIDETLFHAFSYLSENTGVMSSPSDLSSLVIKLKNLYMASKMSDPQLIKMRDLADTIVKRSVSSRNKAALSSVRTALQVYIVLRAFAMKHYSSS